MRWLCIDKNRPDLFASGSGLRTPEQELTPQIHAMLNWARDFVINMKICVLAADVILDEEGDLFWLRHPPHGQRLCMMPASFSNTETGCGGHQKCDGTEIFGWQI